MNTLMRQRLYVQRVRLLKEIEIDDDPVASVKGGKKRAAVVSDDYDDDGGIFGDGAAFNDDELDLEGFEISEGNPYE